MDAFGVLIFLAVTFLIIFNVIRNVMRQLGEARKHQPWETMTPVERNVQQELERQLRQRRPVPAEPLRPPAEEPAYPLRPVAPPVTATPYGEPPPPPSIPVPQRQAAVTPRKARPKAKAAAPKPGATAYPPPRRPQRLNLNPRTMARVAILSEIWRPPVALRREEPWERG